MKTSTLTSLFALTLGLSALAPLAHAGGDGDHKPAQRQGGDRIKLLAQELGLTEDQKAKITPLLKAEMDQLKALRDDESVARDQKRAKLQEIRQATRTQVRALLTPEQQAKFDALPARGPGGPGGPGHRGE